MKSTNPTWCFLLSTREEGIVKVEAANIFEGVTRGTTVQSK